MSSATIRSSLPSGTVTFLFTDIEGSTKLARANSEKWEHARTRHNTILQSSIQSQNGYVFQVIGDSYCSAFHKSGEAIKAAISTQKGLQNEPWEDTVIRVRMGVHTGEAEIQSDGQYQGYLALSLVQRIMSAGHGGQILLSGATENLLRGQLADEVDLIDMGKHNFKDVPQAVRVFQVVAPDLQRDFPSLRTFDILPNNLPAQLTSFVGREKELADVKRLLKDTHMLTLIGPGGTGKTRLSIQAANDVLSQYPDGVWLVDLAPILDPQLVPRTTAITIGLRDEPQRPVIDMLCDYLGKKKMLIILDNCEHLVDACAQIVDRILHAAPDVQILAGSREALGIAGEVTYRVPSLKMPDVDHLPSIDSLSQYEAVKLFIDRATAAIPEFKVTNENAPALAQICYRLDGIPLAIELAAGKIRVLSVEQIAKRLDDRFRLLTGGSRTALERHQTLRAAVDWSYNLLPKEEQLLFKRLSVFLGGWTLEAAESVCSMESEYGAIKSDDILALLEQLVNKSLVITEEEHGESRYHMLETIRQYTNEKLVESGESDVLRDKHLEFFLNLAETAEPHLIGPEQLKWLAQLDDDYENLRAALEWSLGKESAVPSLIFCRSLEWFWEIRGYLLEGVEWCNKALAKSVQHGGNIEKVACVGALLTLAEFEWQLGNYERLLSSAQESIALASEVANKREIAIAKYYVSAGLMFNAGDNEQAQSLMEQSVSEFRELDEIWWETACFSYYGSLLMRQGKSTQRDFATKYLELARQTGERTILAAALSVNAYWLASTEQVDHAREFAEESDNLLRQLGSKNTSYCYEVIANIAWTNSNYEKAKAIYLEHEELFRVVGEQATRAQCLKNLGLLEMDQGNIDQAKAYLEEALRLAQETGNKSFFSICLVEISNLAFQQGNLAKFKMKFMECISLRNALDELFKILILMTIINSLYIQQPIVSARVLGIIDNWIRKDYFSFLPFTKRHCVRAEAYVRGVIDDEIFETAFVEGQRLSPDEGLDLAMKTVEEM